MLGDKRFLRSIKARNLLSFGPDTPELELKSLNVLIGPNAAGKSNLIEAISLLHACPADLLEPIRSGGGIAEWLWKGAGHPPIAELDVGLNRLNQAANPVPLRHRLALGMVGNRAELVDEAVENECRKSPNDPDVYFYYRYQKGHPVLHVESAGAKPTKRKLQREDLRIDQSVLSQRKDPDQYPELTYLGDAYSKIRIFRDWDFCRGSRTRRPQPADSPADFLNEDATNLAMVLNRLDRIGSLGDSMLERLREADGSISRISTSVDGGTVQIYLHYEGLKSPVPAARLSDGTVRYLALLSILLHPAPPPLVCIEEPELGLHPDLLPGLSDLLIQASHRMQLVVSTHSDILVDGLTKVPESVIVCEKHGGSTQMTRRTSAELAKWLGDYGGLGQLWRSGEIGGNRW